MITYGPHSKLFVCIVDIDKKSVSIHNNTNSYNRKKTSICQLKQQEGCNNDIAYSSLAGVLIIELNEIDNLKNLSSSQFLKDNLYRRPRKWRREVFQ